VNKLFRRQVTTLTLKVNELFEILFDYCRQEFELSYSGSSGSSKREQLESVWRQLGYKPPELEDLIELPDYYQDMWRIFLDLNSTRGHNGFSPLRISYTEISNYCQLLQINLTPIEIEAIAIMDRIVLEVNSKQEKQNSK